MLTENDLARYVPSRILERGRNLYYDGHVGYIRFENDSGYGHHLYAYVRSAHSATRYKADVVLDESGDRIISFDCSCPYVTQNGFMCKHISALMMKVIYDVRKLPDLPEEVPDQPIRTFAHVTDFRLRALIENTSPRPVLNAEKGKIELVSEFASDEQYGMRVSFRIGRADDRKKYILKDIENFARSMENEEEVSYGKNCTFVHTLDAFTEGSRPMAAFLCRLVSIGDILFPAGYIGSGYRPVKRELRLRGSLLDDFFSALNEKEMYNAGAYAYTPYTVKNGMPDIAVTLKKSSDGYMLSSRPFTLYEGKQYLYILPEGDNTIIKTAVRDKTATGLMENLAEAAGAPQFLAESDLEAFASRVYIKANDFIPVSSPDFPIEIYLPEKPKFEVYLDLPQKNLITCRIDACYTSGKYNILDRDNLSGSGRDPDAENEFDRRITPWFNSYDPLNHLLDIIDDDEKMYLLLTEGIPVMQQEASVFISDSLKKLFVLPSPHITVGVSAASDLLKLDISSDELSNEELADILSRYDRRKKFYRLKNGSFIKAGGSLNQLEAVSRDLQISQKDLRRGQTDIPAFRAFYLDEMDDTSLVLQRDEHFCSLISRMKEMRQKTYTPSDHLDSIMRDYQKKGFSWLCSLKDCHFAGLLADEMGLGKTLQVIAFLESWKDRKRTLVVCPASLVYNWSSEFRKFAPDMPAEIISGPANIRRERIRLSSENAVLITSYDLLKRDLDTYSEINFSCHVIDEAQYIKNSSTQAARAVKSIRSSFRIALTGTPIENRLSELWSIFDFLMPGLLFSYARFKKEIEEAIVLYDDDDARLRLQRMTGPFILRRLKKDVLADLPPKLEEVIYSQLEGEQKLLYQARAQRLKKILGKQSDQEFRENKIMVLAELTRLRQLCCSPSLIYDNYKENSAKEDLCIDMIRSAAEGGHKILLFSQFTSMLETLTARLNKENIRYHLLTGATAKKQRIDMVEAFDSDDIPVFCISLKAGGTGLNLAAADIVIHYDPWWNTAVENQASDRAHRIGQKNVVTVFRLIMKDTIEERIIDMQQKKAGLAEDILSSESMSSSTLTKEDLLGILE